MSGERVHVHRDVRPMAVVVNCVQSAIDAVISGSNAYYVADGSCPEAKNAFRMSVKKMVAGPLWRPVSIRRDLR